MDRGIAAFVPLQEPLTDPRFRHARPGQSTTRPIHRFTPAGADPQPATARDLAPGNAALSSFTVTDAGGRREALGCELLGWTR